MLYMLYIIIYLLFSYLKWKYKSIWIILITIWIIIPTLTAWFLNSHNKSAFLHRLHGVKVKLSYKIEGLERLFFQLIEEKSTNLDKFPNWTTTKYWNLFVPSTKISEKISPINMSHLKSWFPPLQKGARGGGGGNCVKRKYKHQTQVSIFDLKTLQILTYFFDWLYFTQCLTFFSSINHLLRFYAWLLILFHLT